MTTFDTALVGRWFDFLLEQGRAGDELWGLRPSTTEKQVLAGGREAIAAAVAWSALPSTQPAPADQAAALLHIYLTGLATGIAGARQAMVASGDLEEVAAADRLCLVAGLIAAAAAIQVAPGENRSAASGDHGDRPGQSAVELARAAGTTAAELVVDGADLHAITSAAAAAVLAGGPPDAAIREVRYRSRALVGAVLVALQRSTAPAGAPVQPPSCGAGPGVNIGAELLGEVTFTMFASQADSDRLQAVLVGLSDEVVVWSEGDRRSFHVHTRMAGEVIAEAYAAGTVFSLIIGRLD